MNSKYLIVISIIFCIAGCTLLPPAVFPTPSVGDPNILNGKTTQASNVLEIDVTATPVPTFTPIPTEIPQPVGHDGTCQAIFHDEFDGSTLDTNKWHPCYWWDNGGCTNAGNDELEWYLPENVRVNEGNLELWAMRQSTSASDGNTYDFTSGMVTTGRSEYETSLPIRFAFKYGYAEIRAKIPTGQGLWPAFWLLPDDHTSLPEIDVMEMFGQEPHQVHMNYHYPSAEGGRKNIGDKWIGEDLSQDWHTFAVDWQPDAIIWYVDGIERWRFDDPNFISDKNMYLIVNLAVGGNYPGNPNDDTPFPSVLEIDYVRVWKCGE